MKQRIRNYEIESIDDNNYAVNKIGISDGEKTKGQETLSLVGYFNTLESAAKRIAQLCGDKTEDMKSWLAEYRKVKDEFAELLS